MDLNRYTLLVFAPVLVIAGLLGFIIPRDKALTSGAPAYNIFHIVFGLIGLAVALLLPLSAGPRVFNLGFGVIDLYQALASGMQWPPAVSFRWKKADDFLHVVIGLALVGIAIFG